MLEEAQSELAELQELCAVQEKRGMDVLHVLLRDLSDMGTVICVYEMKPVHTRTHPHTHREHSFDFWPFLSFPHAVRVVGVWEHRFFRRRVLSASSLPHKAPVWIEKPHQSHQADRVHPWAHFTQDPDQRESASVLSRTRLSGDVLDVSFPSSDFFCRFSLPKRSGFFPAYITALREKNSIKIKSLSNWQIKRKNYLFHIH